MLTRLHLSQFRCHEQLELGNLGLHSALLGSNGKGKTSILEAIFYLARSRSFRTSQNRELVLRGKKALAVTGEFSGEDFQKLRIEWSGDGRKLSLDQLEKATFREYWGKALVVVFKNEDRLLVQGAASTRRRWIDSQIASVNPSYLQSLQKAQLLLRQRNALLRQARPDRALWEILVGQVDGLTERIESDRKQFNDQAFPLAERLYGELTGQKERLKLRYEGDFEKSKEVHLDELWDRERHLKVAQRGPHRDDWQILLDDKSLRAFGSEGQQKSAALTLRMVEMKLLQQSLGRSPILLFDDVLNELDAVRKKKFWGLMDATVQMFFATTEEANLPEGYSFDKYRVSPGLVEKH
jgi:DNA replication and repair protein RecF